MEETRLRKKVDITDKVIGKMNGQLMTLYVNNRVIGSMNLNEAAPLFHLKEEYGLEDGNRIYQIQEEGVQKEYYVEGCDLGWC